jgi:predicted lipid-binding transport protein (Tim44 family)
MRFVFFLLFFFLALGSNSFARAGASVLLGNLGNKTTLSAPEFKLAPVEPTPATVQPIKPASFGQAVPGWLAGSFGRNFIGGLTGGILGGLIFRSLGLEGNGLGGSGIGLIEILIFAVIGFGIFIWMKRNSNFSFSSVEEDSPSVIHQRSPFLKSSYRPGCVSTSNSAEEGIKAISALDSQFNEDLFKKLAADIFFKIQIGWVKRDISHISNFLTPQMNSIFERELGRLKAELNTNYIENISLFSVNVEEAWQEEENDYITTSISASLIDYTKDDLTGEIVSGSDSEPVSFSENWTFTRQKGIGTFWLLTAIQQN